MSEGHCLPLESPIGDLLGRELYEIALGEVPHGLLESACGYISSMLTSDPASVFESVLLPASGTNRHLKLSIRVREDFRRNVAAATRDYSISFGCHEQAPPNDSAHPL